MSVETARALEIDSIRRLLSAFAATDLGAAAICELEPLEGDGELELERELQEEVARLLSSAGALLPSADVAFADALVRLGRRTGIGTDQLLALAALLELFDGAVARLGSQTTPALFELLRTSLETGGIEHEGEGADDLSTEDPLDRVRQLARQVRTVLDSKGAVRNDASPALATLVSSVRRSRESLYSSFTSYARQHGDVLGDDTVMRAEGRLALLLPAGSRGRIPGIVHGRSGTEKSYYFEPLELVEDNNKLQEHQSQEEAERTRLLVELATAFENNADLVERVGRFTENLDQLQAAVRFAADLEAQHPELVTADPTWTVHGARHPLLDERLSSLRERHLGFEGHRGAVVPLDIVAFTDRVLVITGPNAGGKTVALKTLGVLSYLAACGWPVPLAASPASQMPHFRHWIAVVGDEQDVLAEQSTFSARLMRLREVWEAASEGTLVLLDEVGSGTNPEEGAALSIALLERLVERGCFAVMTTHLLQVANAALSLDGCASLAMELDKDTGAPTYKIHAGAPGSSHALDLARRLGLAPEWLARAEELLGEEQMTLRHLIAQTERSRQEATEIEEQLRNLSENQKTLQRRQEEALLTAQQERLATRKKASAELEQFRRTARDQLAAELKLARSKNSASAGASVRTAQKEAARLASQLVSKSGLAESLSELSAAADEAVQQTRSVDREKVLEAGDAVRHRALGWSGRIDKLIAVKNNSSASKADVIVRGKRMRCALSELEFDRGTAKASTKHKFAGAKSGVTINRAPGAEAGVELMLVGERVAPALDRVDRFVEGAIVASLEQVRIVHGFGSGRLKDAIRSHLHGHPLIAKLTSAPAALGGDGATIVHFKDE